MTKLKKNVLYMFRYQDGIVPVSFFLYLINVTYRKT